jgi:hypothetical protein
VKTIYDLDERTRCRLCDYPFTAAKQGDGYDHSDTVGHMVLHYREAVKAYRNVVEAAQRDNYNAKVDSSLRLLDERYGTWFK